LSSGAMRLPLAGGAGTFDGKQQQCTEYMDEPVPSVWRMGVARFQPTVYGNCMGQLGQ